MLFHLQLPGTGANYSIVWGFFIRPLFNSAVIFAFTALIFSISVYTKGKQLYIPFESQHKIFQILLYLVLAGSVLYLLKCLNIPGYLRTKNAGVSKFYEENYIDPKTVRFDFPDKKRNLIVIFVESLETGFLSKSESGAFSEDLMPHVKAMMRDHISFTSLDQAQIYGDYQAYGTDWTIAGIVGQYTGVPLTITFINLTGNNHYGDVGDQFLINATSLGDILANAGYHNYLFSGSDGRFSGLNSYFNSHQTPNILDYEYFKNNQQIPQDYKVWWGIEDRKLYQFTKDKLVEIAKDGPFFATLLTLDTHPREGYLDEFATREYDTKFKNVLHDADKQLQDFLVWLQTQDFYENTTLVILGDHLFQDNTFFPKDLRIKKISKDDVYADRENMEKRHCINIFINSKLNPQVSRERKYTPFDLFPTLLESIGVSYNAEGLGLGRSLTKGGETLLEKEAGNIRKINEELRHPSKLYKKLWGAE